MERGVWGAVDWGRRRRGAAATSEVERTSPVASPGSSNNSRLIAVGAIVLLVGVILVLLILRGSVGDDPPPEPVAAGDEGDGDPAEERETPELVDDSEAATARVPLPLELADGFEAVTVRVSHVRGVAALPEAGDRVVLYRLPAEPDDDEGDEADDAEEPSAAPEDDAERLLEDVEVLGVIGPRPSANDGTLTFVVAVEEADVPSVLPLARDGAIWFTLRPGDDDADADADTADAAPDTEDEA